MLTLYSLSLVDSPVTYEVLLPPKWASTLVVTRVRWCDPVSGRSGWPTTTPMTAAKWRSTRCGSPCAA